MTRTLRYVALAALACACAGCGGMDSSAMGGNYSGGHDFGATQGGVQDMTLARDLVDQGKVPPAEAFIVEAMYSEHDLPLTGAPCVTTLCLRSAMGVAPDAKQQSAAWVQVGMSSNIDPETYQRPSLSVVATVDVSGSMGWDYGSGQISGGSISRALLLAIASELGAEDHFTLVTYGSTASQPLGWTPGGSPEIPNAINQLDTSGSTNMESGLQLAFKVAGQAPSADQVRVLLFTDEQPNVGVTSPSSFRSMTQTAAESGVGLTVFGVGLGLNASLMKTMSELRGGNAFSMMDPEAVPGFMQDNWPWFVSPIAYDLHLSAQPVAPLTLVKSYGFPGDGTISSLDVSTVFLSKKRGGLLLELSPGSAPLDSGSVSLDLSYTDLAGQAHQNALAASYAGQPLDQNSSYLPQAGLARAVSLALLVTAMHDAATLYQTSHEQAIALFVPALERFTSEAANDADLEPEVQFASKLLELMQQGAAQGNFYP